MDYRIQAPTLSKKKIFSKLSVEIRMICFIFTDTSCISGEMRERTEEKIMCKR